MSHHRASYCRPSRTPPSRLFSSGWQWLPVLALVVGLGAGVAAPAGADASGTALAADDSVAAAVHAFHDALAAGDSASVLALLHPDLRVFESGHAEDLGEYRSGHLGADMEFAGSTERELLDEEVTRLDEELALYLSEYRMTGTFRGREIDARGAETMVLVRTEGGWRIRHIHWSSR